MGQLSEMQVFVKIVDAGNISKAAEQLGIAKSAVSRRLAELERRLDVQLLTRTTRTSHLTDAGRSYYQRANQILEQILELDADMSCSVSALQGTLNIAVPYSFGLLHLGAAINEFTQIHPNIVINLNFADRQVDLIEEGFDLAIRIAELKDSSLIVRKIAPIRLVLCASPEYLAKKGTPKTPAELKQHSALHYTYSAGISWKFVNETNQVSAVKVPPKMTANNGDFLQDMTLAGHGLTILPTFIAAENLCAGRLTPLLKDHKIPHLNAYIVYPQTRHLSKNVRTFIDFLTTRFAGEPYWDASIGAQKS